MKIKRLLLAGLMAICGMASILAMPVQDAAAAEEAAAKIKCPAGSKFSGQERNTYAECNLSKDGNNSSSTVMDKVNAAINVVLGVLGVVAVVMIILGGIQYVTSQGDAAKAAKARNTILFSIVGLVIALLAFAIVNFVLTNVF